MPYAPIHGHARGPSLDLGRSPTYSSWAAMKQRCLNVNCSGYKDYGAKGITVCERWLTFANFLEDMGERPPNTSINRINNLKGYEPGNCEWATDQQQHANQQHNGPAKKTHCKVGHELTEENSLWYYRADRGVEERRCRECSRQSHRNWLARQKAN